MLPRLADVAAHAGVSQATVSRVLNRKSGVSESTRRSVLSAAEALGYEGSRLHRPASASLLGLIVPELENPIFAAFAQQITSLLVRSGYAPMLGTQTATGVSEDEWIEMFLDQGAGGMIFVSGMHSDTLANPDRYHRLRELRVAMVLINGYMDGLDAAFISDDDAAAMGLAVAHLTSLRHRRIGLAVGSERYVPVIRKVDGFRNAVQASGHVVEHHIEYSLFTVEGGYTAALRLLELGVTAIVCASDLMALGAIRACRTLGLLVPDDVSIIGYDDSTLISFSNPALTTIRQSVPAMSTAAVRMVVAEIQGTPAPRREYMFQPELMVRASTGPPPESSVKGPPAGLWSAPAAARPAARPPERAR